jgi:hypothetical protein
VRGQTGNYSAQVVVRCGQTEKNRRIDMWQGVCIHHSLTRDTVTSSWEAIRKYHVDNNGWMDIGYHYGIEDVGGVLTVRVGRPTSLPGAHAPGLNASHIGICVVGCFDTQTPTEGQLIVLGRLIRDLATSQKFDINHRTIRYHRDVSLKTCPGAKFPDKDTLIKYV